MSRPYAVRLGTSLLVAFLLHSGVLGCSDGDRTVLTAADFVGSQECLACHEEMASVLGTAHHQTSRTPSDSSITGSFAAEDRILRTSNPYLRFEMEARPDGFYQNAVTDRGSDTTTRSERIDIVIGSGRRGQTYLYWQGDSLFQLPISYWTALESWVNSPGYRDGVANFARPITPRCLECHATFVESRPDTVMMNRYDPSTFHFAVSCERCHGPGREHSARPRSWLTMWRGRAIANPANLPRDRHMDVCALCHSGVGESIAPPFSYVAGESLEEYLVPAPVPPGEEVDVHGNQVALLERSRCFQASTTMTCSTCHDVHVSQRDPDSYVPRCMECHEVQSCGLYPERGAAIADGCVDCHMPDLPSSTVVSSHEGRTVQPRIRSHWIRVYREGG